MTSDEHRTFTAEEKQKCAERELRMRSRVYPRWVEQGRMSSANAEREIALMAAIHQDYCTLAAKERLL